MGKKKILLLALVLLSVLVSDQLSKRYVSSSFTIHESREIIPDFFHLTYIHNKGAAFGILSSGDRNWVTPLFLGITLVAIGFLGWMFVKVPTENTLILFALSLILGGALGNLLDRAIMGEVIDFLDVHWHEHHWPAFNVADSAISVGVSLFLIDIIKGGDDHSPFKD